MEVVEAPHRAWLKEEEVAVLMVLIHSVGEAVEAEVVVEGHRQACRRRLKRI